MERNSIPLDAKAEGNYDTLSPDVSATAIDKVKLPKSDDGLSMCSSGSSGGIRGSSCKENPIRSQLAQQMLSSTSRVLKKPLFAIRPRETSGYESGSGRNPSTPNLALDAKLLKLIFRYLPQRTLIICSLVCKVWADVSVDPDFWKIMNFTEMRISASLLPAIVRRQPEHLVFNWTQISKKQLAWIIARLPALKKLSLQNCSVEAVLALHTCLCPPLQILDISFVRGLSDGAIRSILSSPKDSWPSLTDSNTRLRDLKILRVAGTNISDLALHYISRSLPHLFHLDLSCCQRITDVGIAEISTSPTAKANLVEINLSGCRLISEISLDHLEKLDQLMWLDLRNVSQISVETVIKFVIRSKHNLCIKDQKLIQMCRISRTPH